MGVLLVVGFGDGVGDLLITMEGFALCLCNFTTVYVMLIVLFMLFVLLLLCWYVMQTPRIPYIFQSLLQCGLTLLVLLHFPQHFRNYEQELTDPIQLFIELT